MRGVRAVTGGYRHWIAASAVLLIGTACMAGTQGAPTGTGHADQIGRLLLALVVILAAAKAGSEIFGRLGQPAVLGELVFGIVLGSLHFAGVDWFEFIKSDAGVSILAEIGIALLLFQVGLESDLGKMVKVAASSLVVAALGVAAPLLLGWGVAAIFMPQESIYSHLFVGATLCATSVGITARVLLDLGRIHTAEARIILGAAVIDDVEGLVILAIIQGVISAANSGGALSAWAIALIVVKATLFLVGALLVGKWVAPRVFRFAAHFRARDLLLTTSLGLCFGFGYLGYAIGLAPIVGAFAAGLILEEVHWRSFTERGEHSITDLVKPLVAFLAPVFFVVMGTRVDLAQLFRPEILAFAVVLTIAAVVGKQVCGLGVLQNGLDRLSVGAGMIPRGEVGLIFASVGANLTWGDKTVLGQSAFSALVFMVAATTMLAPPLLKWTLSRWDKRPPAGH